MSTAVAPAELLWLTRRQSAGTHNLLQGLGRSEESVIQWPDSLALATLRSLDVLTTKLDSAVRASKNSDSGRLLSATERRSNDRSRASNLSVRRSARGRQLPKTPPRSGHWIATPVEAAFKRLHPAHRSPVLGCPGPMNDRSAPEAAVQSARLSCPARPRSTSHRTLPA